MDEEFVDQGSSDFVDQSAMVDDFLNSELVYQESGDTFAPQNAETAENEKPEGELSDFEEQQSTEKPEKSESNPAPFSEDPLQFVIKDSDGTERFDPLSALDFINRKTTTGDTAPAFKAELPPIDSPVQPQPNGASPENSYEDSLKSIYLAGFDYLESFLKQGYPYDQAMVYAKQAADTDLRNHLHEKQMKDFESRVMSQFEEKKSVMQNKNEVEAARVDSTKNLYEMAKAGGYGSIEKLQQVLIHPDIGGDVIHYLFTKDSQGKSFKTVDERAAAMNDWFIKFSADKQALGFLEEVARARYSNRLMPEIIKEVRGRKEKVENSNKAAKGMSPASAINMKRTNPASQESNALTEFLGVSSLDEV